MIRRASDTFNPDYPSFAKAVEDWLQSIGKPGYINPADQVAWIIHCPNTTEKNPHPLFLMLDDGKSGYLVTKMPRQHKATARAIACRSPITGDPIHATRVSWDRYRSWENLIVDEWEATLDEQWILQLISLQEHHPALPHVVDMGEVKRIHALRKQGANSKGQLLLDLKTPLEEH